MVFWVDRKVSGVNWSETNKIIHIYSFIENISVYFKSNRGHISFQLKNIRPLLTRQKGCGLGRHRVPKSFNSFNNPKLFLNRKINITTKLFYDHTKTKRGIWGCIKQLFVTCRKNETKLFHIMTGKKLVSLLLNLHTHGAITYCWRLHENTFMAVRASRSLYLSV